MQGMVTRKEGGMERAGGFLRRRGQGEGAKAIAVRLLFWEEPRRSECAIDFDYSPWELRSPGVLCACAARVAQAVEQWCRLLQFL